MEIYTEQYRHKSRRRRIRVGMFVAFAGLAVIFYALADRYLIEHVEVEVTPLIRVSENAAIAMGTETAAPGSTEVPTAAPDPDGSSDGEVFSESFADPQPDMQAAARFDAVPAERLDEGTDAEIVSADESAALVVSARRRPDRDRTRYEGKWGGYGDLLCRRRQVKRSSGAPICVREE